MAPPYTGRCFCESVQYRIMQAPLTLYACHSTAIVRYATQPVDLMELVQLWRDRTARSSAPG